jgi:cell wall-associated NlpC family hydrolase
LAAVGFACAQIGKPYVWGGNGEVGFDCSGLTHAAYAATGIDIPRTAQAQYDTGPLLPAGSPLEPGDLVFFGTAGRIHHVGISLGGMLMVNAPDFGQTVKTQDIRGFGDYAGASRPLEA